MKRQYIIYQAPLSTEYTFRDFECAMKNNWSLNDYVAVWRGEIESETINGALEELFYIFNENRPEHYYCRSMSTSDVVLLDGKLYYCDSFGWQECPKERN